MFLTCLIPEVSIYIIYIKGSQTVITFWGQNNVFLNVSINDEPVVLTNNYISETWFMV